VTVTESSESNGEATERTIRLGARRAAVLPRCCSWRQRCSSDAAGQCRGRSDRAQPGGDQAAAGRRASLGRLPAAGPCGVGTWEATQELLQASPSIVSVRASPDVL